MLTAPNRRICFGAALALAVGLALFTAKGSPLAGEYGVIAGFSEPAMPAKWMSKSVDLGTGETLGIQVSNSVPLEAYGKSSGFTWVIGHFISPKGAAKSTILYGYSLDDLKKLGMEPINAKEFARSVIVHKNKEGAYFGNYIQASIQTYNQTISKAKWAKIMSSKIFKEVTRAGHEVLEGGYIATTEKLKGVPVAVKFAGNADGWTFSPSKIKSLK